MVMVLYLLGTFCIIHCTSFNKVYTCLFNSANYCINQILSESGQNLTRLLNGSPTLSRFDFVVEGRAKKWWTLREKALHVFVGLNFKR